VILPLSTATSIRPSGAVEPQVESGAPQRVRIQGDIVRPDYSECRYGWPGVPIQPPEYRRKVKTDSGETRARTTTGRGVHMLEDCLTVAVGLSNLSCVAFADQKEVGV
jgi:hypothetical protein